MTPPNDIKGCWAANWNETAEAWESDGDFMNWWDAGMDLIDEKIDEYRVENPDDRGSDSEIIPDSAELCVATTRKPKPPENLITAEDIALIIEQFNDRSEDYIYEGCGCYEYLTLTNDQEADLEASIRKAFGDFLDRHNLRPTWYVVDKHYKVTAGQVREAFRKDHPYGQ